jgi:hypothetical protein
LISARDVQVVMTTDTDRSTDHEDPTTAPTTETVAALTGATLLFLFAAGIGG